MWLHLENVICQKNWDPLGYVGIRPPGVHQCHTGGDVCAHWIHLLFFLSVRGEWVWDPLLYAQVSPPYLHIPSKLQQLRVQIGDWLQHSRESHFVTYTVAIIYQRGYSRRINTINMNLCITDFANHWTKIVRG